MAAVEIQKVAHVVSAAPLCEREAAINLLLDSFQRKEKPHALVVTTLETLTTTSLQTLQNPASQRCLRKLFGGLMDSSPVAVFRGITSGIDAFLQSLEPSKVHARSVDTCLGLLGSLNLTKLTSDESIVELVSILCNLCHFLGMCDEKYFFKKSHKRLHRILGQFSANRIVHELQKRDSVMVLSMIAFMIHANVYPDQIPVLKEGGLKLFVQHILSSKVAISQSVVKVCCVLFVGMERSLFEESFLPVMKKSLLRNPETVLPNVATLLGHLTLDLSGYVDDLMDPLLGQLSSQREDVGEAAVAAIGGLAVHCTDVNALETMTNKLLLLLKGKSSGINKLNAWSAIRVMANNGVSRSARRELSSELCLQLMEQLAEQIHESGTLAVLACIVAWAPSPGSTIIARLQAGFANKSMNSRQRFAHAETINLLFDGHHLNDAESLVPFLVEIWTKSVGQRSQNLFAVVETLPCLLLLLRVASCSSNANSLVNQKVLPEVLLLTTKTLLDSLDSAGWKVILQVIKLLFTNFSAQISDDSFVALGGVIVTGYLRQPYEVRRVAAETVRSIVSGLDGSISACTLLMSLDHFLAQHKTEWGKLACHLLKSICAVSSPDPHICHKIAITSFRPGAALSTAKKRVWLEILTVIGLGGKSFVKENEDELLRLVHQEQDIDIKCAKAVELCRMEDRYCRILMERCLEPMQTEIVYETTLKDVAIMRTPAGEVYDMSVVESEGLDSANMKRESKLYSYKEQLAAVALQKEILAKRKASGKLELTTKQKEIFQRQLKLEKEIRDRLLPSFESCEGSLKVLNSLVAAVPKCVMQELAFLRAKLLPLVQYSMVAQGVADFWVKLALLAFPKQKFTGLLVGYTSVRLYDCACPIDVAWSWESLSKAAARALAKLKGLYEADLEKASATHTDQTAEFVDGSGSFGFAYALPILVKMLGDTSKQGASVRQEAIQFVSLYLKLVNAVIQTKVGDQVPLVELTDLLLTAIESSASGNQLAAIALLHLCHLAGERAKEASKLKIAQTIFKGTHHRSSSVREIALKALEALGPCLSRVPGSVRHVWVACHETNENNQEIAKKLWETNELSVGEETCGDLLLDVTDSAPDVRLAAASALVEALRLYPFKVSYCVNRLLTMLNEYQPVESTKDDFGRVILDMSAADQWHCRAGVALALQKISPLLPDSIVYPLWEALIPDTLKDKNPDVRHLILQAATEIIKHHGKKQIGQLLPRLENLLDTLPESASSDMERQYLVILLGSLAQHLEPDDARIRPILARLIETLSTPSQQVQEAVAQCLPPLIPSVKEQAPALTQKLLLLLLEAEQYGERRGAAYGLAGLVKGLGISALKQLDIISTLVTNVQDKKNAKHREGALLALEMLSNMLGRLFEPYVVHIMQPLLYSLGDSDQHVRTAAEDCAKMVMANLSAPGVKLVLPALLAGLEQESWRTKAGSVELLGTMAYCAPRQLSTFLPALVPQLIDVLSDTHAKVQKSGEQALSQIGQVIRNPEIQSLVPELLSALADPAHKTTSCMQALLATNFLHYIDAPSLALIMPVIQRAFQDRSSESRKMAAQILGNIYQLTDQKDVEPYLPSIVPGLQKGLLDPAPEVRAVSARALGALVRGMGDKGWYELKPWLEQHMTSANPVDRSGAAQGLSEVIGALGVGKLQELMPEFLAVAEDESKGPNIRDGYIMLYMYLPGVFKDKFLPYVTSILPSLLKALADEKEYVRETALKGGQTIIKQYLDTAIPLMLPQLQAGLVHENWRIRQSSVQLLSDLLFTLTGVTGKMSTEGGDDDSFGTETSAKAVINALGLERRNHVLAGLYMARSDIARQVALGASHVWKVIVANTPRTVREILPVLFQLLLSCLASPSQDRQQVAARSLGELVKKLGDRILVEMIPVLDEGLRSEDPDQRQGVCVALSEIMNNTTKEMVQMYADQLIPTVRTALTDSLPDVRTAAARTFDVLYSNIGGPALDSILTPLLEQLSDPVKGEFALDGLQKVIALKGRHILPHLVPKLTTGNVNCRALARLSAVSGDALSKHLDRILPALLISLSQNMNEQDLEDCSAVLLSVSDHAGLSTMFDLLLLKHKGAVKAHLEDARPAATLLASYMQNTKVDLDPYFPELISGLLRFYILDDPEAVAKSAQALLALVKRADPLNLATQVVQFRRALKEILPSGNEEMITLPGFKTPQGVQPVLTIFREGLLNGPADSKEGCAEGLTEVVSASEPGALRSHVVSLTGPLIRVLGDRYPPNTKTAILKCLSILLEKVAALMKPFLPQLQSTFLKALTDGSSRAVRLSAAKALARLSSIHTKPDQLLQEICTQVKAAQDPGTRESFLLCLRGVIGRLGQRASAESRSLVSTTAESHVSGRDEACRLAAGATLGALVAIPDLDDNEREEFLDNILRDFADGEQGWEGWQGRMVGVQAALSQAGDDLLADNTRAERIQRRIATGLASDKVPVVSVSLRCGALFLLRGPEGQVSRWPTLLQTLARCLNHTSTDVKCHTAIVLHHVAPTIEPQSLKVVISTLVNGTKEKNSAVRTSSEEALVAALRMQEGPNFYNDYVGTMEAGMREALQEVYGRSLVKLARAHDVAPLPPLDDTFQV